MLAKYQVYSVLALSYSILLALYYQLRSYARLPDHSIIISSIALCDHANCGA